MPEYLKQLEPDEALGEADTEVGNGRLRVRCLAERLAPGGKLWLCRFEQTEFLNIAWQEDDNTRYVSASAPRRTLGEVAKRILERFGSFEGLVASEARPGELNPEWFQVCVKMGESFSWEEWKKPWLVPAKDSEMRNSPETTLYVCEGVHRTIVAAVGILNGSVEWSPVWAIVGQERLEECC